MDDTQKPKPGGGASAVQYHKVLVIPNVLCPPPYMTKPQGKAVERKTKKSNCFRQIPSSSSPQPPRFIKYLVAMTCLFPCWMDLSKLVYTQNRTQDSWLHWIPDAGDSHPEVHFRKLFSGINKVRLRSFLPDPSSSK